MEIAVIGTGYVGLVAGACFADLGHKVTCVDKLETKIQSLQKGEIPIFEPGLDRLVLNNQESGRLSFTTDLPSAVKKAKAIFIAVGTPPGEDGSADLQHVLAVAEAIGQNLNDYKVIIDKSTVPVGTADKVKEAVAKHTTLEFDVVSNPEFLKEGAALDDFLKPDRVVIGVSSEKAKEVMEELYGPFLRNNHPIIFMDIKSAEMTKYAANAMLATRISFMNEISRLCDKVGADVNMVRKGIGSDKRIGHPFLYPGIGYGGSCFPKDVKAIIKTAEENDLDFQLLKAVENVNETQKKVIVNQVTEYFGGAQNLKGKTFAIWGLAFKPNTDDIREAPSLVIIEALLAAGANIKATDPEAMQEVKKILGDKISYYSDKYQAVENSDALIVCTEWSEFRVPDFSYLKEKLNRPVIFDGRNLYLDIAKKEGFDYFCIGSNI